MYMIPIPAHATSISLNVQALTLRNILSVPANTSLSASMRHEATWARPTCRCGAGRSSDGPKILIATVGTHRPGGLKLMLLRVKREENHSMKASCCWFTISSSLWLFECRVWNSFMQEPHTLSYSYNAKVLLLRMSLISIRHCHSCHPMLCRL